MMFGTAAVQDIDVERLIREVRKRPELWDVASDLYKDKNRKKDAWIAVCAALVPGFTRLDVNEKNYTGEQLLRRWKHLRDAYARSLRLERKSQSGGGRKRRKYLYGNELAFLLKNNSENAGDDKTTPSELADGKYDDSQLDDFLGKADDFTDYCSDKKLRAASTPTPPVLVVQQQPSKQSVQRSSSTKHQGPSTANGSTGEESQAQNKQTTSNSAERVVDHQMEMQKQKNIVVSGGVNTMSKRKSCPTMSMPVAANRFSVSRGLQQQQQQQRLLLAPSPDEDIAFFQSILPVVRKFDDDQKLEFRWEVLNAIKTIRKSARNDEDAYRSRPPPMLQPNHNNQMCSDQQNVMIATQSAATNESGGSFVAYPNLICYAGENSLQQFGEGAGDDNEDNADFHHVVVKSESNPENSDNRSVSPASSASDVGSTTSEEMTLFDK